MITIVGLGVERGDLTERGKRAILSAEKVIVRTTETKSFQSVADLGVAYTSLDFVYEKSRSFTTLHKSLAKEVLEQAKDTNVAYCVDGSPMEDNSVKLLQRRKDVRIVDGVSKSSYFASLAKLSSCSYTALSAYDIGSYKRRALPLVVYDLDNDFTAGDVKLALSDLIGEETTVKFIRDGKVKKIKLYELDREEKYDYTCALVAEETPLTKRARFDFIDLCDIISLLRQPDGCPWDRVQTPESIKMAPVEEAYELMEAVNLADDDKILEESGDILLQAVFYAVMKEEEGAFNASDILSAECEKMISRHTHIFGKDHASDEASALSVWDKNKMAEKHQTTYSDAVNDVPNTFPALLRAQKTDKRMAKGGWNDADERELSDKIVEELREVSEAMHKGDPACVKEEMGDLLLACVRLSGKAGVNAEEALLDAVEKVKKRFCAYEKLVLADGREMNALTRAEKDEYYKRAKELCR